jgi:hypothetical protein
MEIPPELWPRKVTFLFSRVYLQAFRLAVNSAKFCGDRR